MDALAEWNLRISPYAYAVNNPINAVDLFGLAVTYIKDKDGNIIGYRITGDDIVTYQGALNTVNSGNASMDNLYASLGSAASQNDGEGGAMANTIGYGGTKWTEGRDNQQGFGIPFYGSGGESSELWTADHTGNPINTGDPVLEQKASILKWFFNLFKDDEAKTKEDENKNPPSETIPDRNVNPNNQTTKDGRSIMEQVNHRAQLMHYDTVYINAEGDTIYEYDIEGGASGRAVNDAMHKGFIWNKKKKND